MWEYLTEHVSGLGMERIDAKLTEGVPDVTWCYGPLDRAGWLELKQIPERFSPSTTKIPWKSPAQPLWLYRWARRGGRAGVLLRDGADGWFFWRARGTPDWHKAMLAAPLPRPDWFSARGLRGDDLVAALIA